jgi:hypothetical protein
MAEHNQPDMEGGTNPEAGKAPREAAAPAPHADEAHAGEAHAGEAHTDEAEAHAELMGVEPESVDVRPLLFAAIVMAVSVITIVLIVFQWSEIEFEHARINAIEMTGYPQERELDFQAREKLEQYGVVNRDSGVYRIPIDRAIELMVNRAVAPTMSTLPGQQPVSTPEQQPPADEPPTEQ